jgi:hypothetical protein
MASRKSARSDQVAPAPDCGTEEVGGPPSAQSQSGREAGRGGALRARQSTSSASPPPSESPESRLSPSSIGPGKRPRVHSPLRTGDVQLDEMYDSVMQENWSSMEEDVAPLRGEFKEGSVRTSLPPSKSPASAPSAVPNERDYAPSWVGKLKLREVGLDPRMDTVLVVTLTVAPNMPSPPQVERARQFLSRESRRKLLASLLGSSTGFNITLPDIPRVLISGDTTDEVIQNCRNLTGRKAEWVNELHRTTRVNGELIREMVGSDVTVDARLKACDEVWELLAAVDSSRDTESTDQLWSKSEVSDSWAELLAPLSEIMSDRGGDPSSGRSYQLRLHGMTPEVTHIIACLLTSYGTLRNREPDIAAAFDEELQGPSATRGRASKTDSDSGSDGEDGWKLHGVGVAQVALVCRLRREWRHSQRSISPQDDI